MVSWVVLLLIISIICCFVVVVCVLQVVGRVKLIEFYSGWMISDVLEGSFSVVMLKVVVF